MTVLPVCRPRREMPTTPSRPAAPAGRPTAHSRHHLCQSATAATNAAVLLNGRPSLRSQFLTETARTRCQWQSRAACASRLQAPAVSTWTNDLRSLHHCVSTTPERAHACCSSGRPRRARSSPTSPPPGWSRPADELGRRLLRSGLFRGRPILLCTVGAGKLFIHWL